MKIGFVSDLHLDHNQKFSKDIIEELKSVIDSKRLDKLIISGDISSNYIRTISIIDELNRDSVANIYYVPGNHDVWEVNPQDTTRILNEFKRHKYCLLDKVVPINDKQVLLGAFTWYDFSLSFDDIPKAFVFLEDKIWSDFKYVKLNEEWDEFSTREIDALERKIESIPKDKEIILCNHFVPCKEFTTVKRGDHFWNISNKFMGSNRISKIAENNENVKYVTFGHSHIYYGEKELNGVTYLNAPIGYGGTNEWINRDFKRELKEKIIVIKF